ncbi:uncharacterized protein LOC113216450 [Frankliniella occidentalis]|uniref:Uncharacterized protein LOC113216450 n=1 Tax=Frankliniella occidentalis TaxID=133901 RepID=A0A9C6XA18_FRAOC|nr:uncharacterized protein LOC113216450 [Frankliniella occidentalis]
MATSVLTLEQLPADVIVMVLQYLPVKDVFDCRLVCKRLCDLALHWDVWRHRSLEDDAPHAGAVLRLAPCLNKLQVKGRVPTTTTAATTTRCAVASLELYSDTGAVINAAEYALAVRNQELLGRLRKLELNTDLRPASDVLVKAVAMCSNLESLEIFDDLPDVSHTVVHGPPRPSLTNFRCSVDKNSASFAHIILALHAATLEQVSISAVDDFAETRIPELLVNLPRLRSLRYGLSLCGLNVVVECKTLREVSIYVDSELENIDVLSDFLRRANQLRRVHLDCGWVDEDSHPEVGAVLVRALTWSGRSHSHLEWLALEGVTDVRPLLRALPSLPALRHLDLDAAPADELLKSITPVTAPALRSLGVVAREEACPHAWIHGAAVKATLAENPSLHIQLWCLRNIKKCETQDCGACVTGCHREVRWGGGEKIGLYSHDPDKCPSPGVHTDDATDWLRSYFHRYEVACTCTWYHI